MQTSPIKSTEPYVKGYCLPSLVIRLVFDKFLPSIILKAPKSSMPWCKWYKSKKFGIFKVPTEGWSKLGQSNGPKTLPKFLVKKTSLLDIAIVQPRNIHTNVREWKKEKSYVCCSFLPQKTHPLIHQLLLPLHQRRRNNQTEIKQRLDKLGGWRPLRPTRDFLRSSIYKG